MFVISHVFFETKFACESFSKWLTLCKISFHYRDILCTLRRSQGYFILAAAFVIIVVLKRSIPAFGFSQEEAVQLIYINSGSIHETTEFQMQNFSLLCMQLSPVDQNDTVAAAEQKVSEVKASDTEGQKQEPPVATITVLSWLVWSCVACGLLVLP
uniref:Uncharacterized protein n=1 Tax=Physcomitrium patens TaxID=3218 RepID=A0A2K1KFL7_PHYPA|nr:hypothetical protein PHYPA_008950 [Physcomitrium patens]